MVSISSPLIVFGFVDRDYRYKSLATLFPDDTGQAPIHSLAQTPSSPEIGLAPHAAVRHKPSAAGTLTLININKCLAYEIEKDKSSKKCPIQL